MKIQRAAPMSEPGSSWRSHLPAPEYGPWSSLQSQALFRMQPRPSGPVRSQKPHRAQRGAHLPPAPKMHLPWQSVGAWPNLPDCPRVLIHRASSGFVKGENDVHTQALAAPRDRALQGRLQSTVLGTTLNCRRAFFAFQLGSPGKWPASMRAPKKVLTRECAPASTLEWRNHQ